MKLLIVGVALLAALPASAEKKPEAELIPSPPCRTQTIIDRLCVGMKPSQVISAYTDVEGNRRSSRWLSRLNIDLAFNNPEETISEVTKTFTGVTGTTIVAQLSEKYGQPVSRHPVVQNSYAGSYLLRHQVSSRTVEQIEWRTGDITITLVPEGDDAWDTRPRVHYKVAAMDVRLQL